MQYILKRTVSPEHLQGWKVEACSPFEVSGAVMSGAVVLFWKTAEALAEFFGHPENPAWTAETLNYTVEFPAEFKPGGHCVLHLLPPSGNFSVLERAKRKLLTGGCYGKDGAF